MIALVGSSSGRDLSDEWAELPAVRMGFNANGNKNFSLLLTHTHQEHFHETPDRSMPIDLSLP